ncbi:hypothetical protein Y032_0009g488 [Ancylostoma ceylanicum]|uniref:Peptidase A1 domain-containing protein n=1 Tax=Ancylostoma ceylanicum TaxID=53326 RepID=A0A016VIG5_9BILA|nr:hypothetical protein Y032_0009g488 [Ancylostoma ceylanicum]
MRLVISILLIGVASCNIFQTSLDWKESKMVELIRQGKYADYVKNLNSLRKSASPTDVSVYELDSEYAHKITIGTPPQPFFVWITMSTSMLWVPDPKCGTKTCKDKRKFLAANSRTFSRFREHWKSTSYGGAAEGELVGSDVMMTERKVKHSKGVGMHTS